MSEAEAKLASEAILSGWITTGPKTKEFERQIGAYVGTSKAVCLNSATAAMEMALRLIGVGPEDEVIVPAYTYTASASVTQHVGCKLVLVDSQKDNVQMDYDRLAEAITENTKVICPVDLGGVMYDYDKLFAVIEAKNIDPDLVIDGEFQFDAAVSAEVAKTKCPDSKVAGQANTFIFPLIEAGNIGYKIAQRLGGYEAYGPILQGLNAPINDLSRGCNADEVYKMAIITAGMA